MKKFPIIITAIVFFLLFVGGSAMSQPVTSSSWSGSNANVSNVGSSQAGAGALSNVSQNFEASETPKFYPGIGQATFAPITLNTVKQNATDDPFGETGANTIMYLPWIEGDMLKVNDYKNVKTTIEWANKTNAVQLPTKMRLLFSTSNNTLHGAKEVAELVVESTDTEGVPPLRLVKDAVSQLRKAQSEDGKYLGAANALHISGEGAREFAKQLSLSLEPGFSSSTFGGDVSFVFGSVSWNNQYKKFKKNFKIKAVLVPQAVLDNIALMEKLQLERQKLAQIKKSKTLTDEISRTRNEIKTWKAWTPSEKK